MQNRAGRLVTKHGQFTPTRVVLKQCGWLSVMQLVHFHSLLLMFNVKLHAKPEYFRSLFNTEFPYRTRLAASMGIRRSDNNNHEVTKRSFVSRSTSMWNEIPASIRSSKSVHQFKKNLKSWIEVNIPLI